MADVAATQEPLRPGSTVGILGGGQLGRMTALAAARLGLRCHVFCAEPDSPAGQVCDRRTVSSFADEAALAHFAERVDVVTYEFENVPLDAVAFLAGRVAVRPGPAALAACQDRVAEKTLCGTLGLPVADWRPVDSRPALDEALAAVGRPAVLKAARLGYDGKGQAMLEPGGLSADAAWARIGACPAVIERKIPFAFECSVIAARGLDGTIVAYPPVRNDHRDHILARTTAPADLAPEAVAAAEAAALALMERLDIVGLLAVEMFVTPNGAVLINELAPRPHNSGHWTIEGCPTDQFEQLVRAVAGLPLGAVRPFRPAVMDNLIGTEVERWPGLLAEPGAHLHLYGKVEARPGRKMGHVTRLADEGAG